MKINLPLAIWFPRETMQDKLIHLNMNTTRNMHYHVLNKVKELFKAHVEHEVMAFRKQWGDRYVLNPKSRMEFHYTIFPESNRAMDVMNPGSVIDKFTCDALVQLGVIKDDNHKIISEFHFSFGGVDKENPRCELTIEPIA